MTVFKTYFKVLKQNKVVIFTYIAILLIFTVFGATNGSTTESFQAKKPDVAIINNDTDSKVVNNLLDYIEKNANIIELENDESVIADALFYREINAVVYIYDGYTEDFLNNKEKKIDEEFTIDYAAAYMEMLLERYFKLADVANNNIKDEDKILEVINDSLSKESTIEVRNTIDTDSLSNVSFYYNFANYSMLAISMYLIAVVMSTFNKEQIKKRNLVSSKKIISLTRELYLGNFVFAIIVWLFVVIVSLILYKDLMLTTNGLWIIFNSFVFMTTALGIGFLVGTILKNKDAINGITNVVALGSSFMCGCFVPISMLPDFVVQISKIFPSHYYVANNELATSIETFNFDTIQPLLSNMLIMVIFAIAFFVLAVIYNKRHSKI